MSSDDTARQSKKDLMKPAPVALFTYNRLRHTQLTIEALLQNSLAGDSELVIFSDGPRSEADRENVESVRKYLRTVTGFKNVQLIERDTNMGLAGSVISGVTEIVNKYGRIIVLEDDMLSSPFFLRFMNDALKFYCDNERVISIHGYLYPLRAALPQTFFLRGADCWGWATWKRGWDAFESDGRKLLIELKERMLRKDFDLNGAHPYTRMLRWQIRGIVDSWAIRWHASAYLAGKLTLYPGRSLIANIGLDASGEHCNPTDKFDVMLSDTPVKIDAIPVEEHAGVRHALEIYYRETRSSILKSAVQWLKRFYFGRST